MTLKIAQFGDNILRKPATAMTLAEIGSKDTEILIAEMKNLLKQKKLGIGLAAPQVGVSVALAIIEIQKTALRDEKEVSIIIINPIIVEEYGRKFQRWEGCISSGPSNAALFAKVPRYKKLKLKYTDEHGITHTKIFEGLTAHVIAHEVDHLNGIYLSIKYATPRPI